MMNAKRIVYLDVAKGIGMILVVMGHVEYISLPVRQFITAFHMPLFFLISGILIWERQEEEKSYIDLVKRKARSMMLPYVIFSLLSFCIEGGRLALKGLDGWDVVFRQLYQSCCLQGVSALWFLPALFMSELVFLGVRKRMSHRWTIVVSSGIVVLCAWLNSIEQSVYQLHADSLKWGMLHDILSMLLRNFLCVGFVAIGYYWSKCLRQKLKSVSQEFLSVMIGIVIASVAIAFNMGVDLRFMQLQFVPFYLAGAVVGGLTVIMLCQLLVRLPIKPIVRLLSFYGRNSLIIMVTHMDFRVLYISIKVSALLTGGLSQILFVILIVVFVFVLEIPIIWFINRFLPFILGKRKENS